MGCPVLIKPAAAVIQFDVSLEVLNELVRTGAVRSAMRNGELLIGFNDLKSALRYRDRTRDGAYRRR